MRRPKHVRPPRQSRSRPRRSRPDARRRRPGAQHPLRAAVDAGRRRCLPTCRRPACRWRWSSTNTAAPTAWSRSRTPSRWSSATSRTSTTTTTAPMIVPDEDGGFLADARADLEEVAAVIGTDFAAGETRRGRRHHRRPGLRAGRPHSGARRAGLRARRLRVRDSRCRPAPHQAVAHQPPAERPAQRAPPPAPAIGARRRRRLTAAPAARFAFSLA